MRLLRTIYTFLRANFLAGLFIAVPFAVTIIFLIWLWEQIDGPLKTFFDMANTREMPWSRLMEGLRTSQYEKTLVPLAGLGLLLLTILIFGIITRSIIGRMALLGVENVVARLPLIGMLYMSLKQLGEAFVTPDGHSKFKRAVAVQFPYKGVWAIGFVTGQGEMLQSVITTDTKPKLLTIFVPTTPLPTAGFMIVVPESETAALDMTVQDALKLVVSGGMINPGDSHRAKPANEITQIIQKRLSEAAESNAGSTTS
ncbi:MAG TPA: DUF502 domain-containing protein [Planctomycetota bacterium]|jgi:uncharacterized membrane protein